MKNYKNFIFYKFDLPNTSRLNNVVKITEVDSNFFKKEYFAPRPNSERLINARLDSEGLNIMQDWKISLSHYLKNAYPDYKD